MISQRTRLSLVQLLAEQDQGGVATLLAKYGADMPYRGSFFAEGLRQAVQEMPGEQALSLAAEAVATRSALRHPITPKTRFDEHFATAEIYEPLPVRAVHGRSFHVAGAPGAICRCQLRGHRLRSWPWVFRAEHLTESIFKCPDWGLLF